MDQTSKIQQQKDTLARRIEIERERIQLVQKRKRTVYEAICALSDPVDEGAMLEYLPVLDLHAWFEVIEERFLGRICGYPICSNEIQVNFRQKFTINRKGGQKEFVPFDSEPNKFCSLRCMCMARAVAVQLDTEEQHLAALRLSSSPRKKEFKLPNDEDGWRQFIPKGENQKQQGDKPSSLAKSKMPNCFVESELVKSLFDLKVADNSAEEEKTDDEDNEEEDENSSVHLL